MNVLATRSGRLQVIQLAAPVGSCNGVYAEVFTCVAFVHG